MISKLHSLIATADGSEYQLFELDSPLAWMSHPSNGGTDIVPVEDYQRKGYKLTDREERYHSALCDMKGGLIDYFESVDKARNFLTHVCRKKIVTEVKA